MTEYLAVRNFTRYQHYKDRRPPWVKLHVDILDDEELGGLSVSARLVAVLLLAVAANRDNKIPDSAAWLAAECSIPVASARVALRELRSIAFVVDYAEDLSSKPEGWASRYVSADLRAEVFEEAGHKCSCGSVENLEIDHIIPISKGGSGEKDNLQVLCRSCNRAKRVRSNGGASAEQPATQEAEQKAGQMSSPRGRPRARGESETERELVEAKASTSKPATKERQPDLLWDTLVREIGPAETKSERGRRNKALKELRDVGATPGEAVVRIGRYRRRWPDIDLTATALAANWSLLASGANGMRSESEDERESRLRREMATRGPR